MLKLAIIAGVTLSALLCGMMTLGGSNGLFQGGGGGGGNRNFEFLNDIKEIFGFSPKSQSQAQFTSRPGNAPSSFSFGGNGGSSSDGSYLPPKSFSEEDYNYTDFTTPLFRIFVLSTTTETPSTSTSSISTTTGNPTTQTTTNASTSTSPPTTTTASVTSPITPSIANPSINTTESTDKPVFKEESLAESSTVSSVSSASPTGYAFQRNPTPQFKVDLIWSTLVPPSDSNAENEVAMSGNLKPSNENTGSGYGGGGGSLPNNGLYLPPNKEYLPPSSQ